MWQGSGMATAKSALSLGVLVECGPALLAICFNVGAWIGRDARHATH